MDRDILVKDLIRHLFWTQTVDFDTRPFETEENKILVNRVINIIFEHVRDRVVYLPVEDESEVRMELAQVLGKVSRGMVGTQLYLLMQYALFISPKRDEEGRVVEKDSE